MGNGPYRGKALKIPVYCEGKTERGLKSLLAPLDGEFRRKGFAISTHPLDGNRVLQPKMGTYVKNEIRDGAPAVFGLVDLHNAHEHFGQDIRTALGGRDWLSMPVSARVEWLRTHIPRIHVDPEYKDKFHIHVAVHDIEALILADTDAIRKKLKCDTLKESPNPENIDDMNPPHIKLNELFHKHLKRSYNKGTDGVSLLASLDFDTVYNKCLYFRSFVDDLRSIAP